MCQEWGKYCVQVIVFNAPDKLWRMGFGMETWPTFSARYTHLHLLSVLTHFCKNVTCILTNKLRTCKLSPALLSSPWNHRLTVWWLRVPSKKESQQRCFSLFECLSVAQQHQSQLVSHLLVPKVAHWQLFIQKKRGTFEAKRVYNILPSNKKTSFRSCDKHFHVFSYVGSGDIQNNALKAPQVETYLYESWLSHFSHLSSSLLHWAEQRARVHAWHPPWAHPLPSNLLQWQQ